MMGGEPIDPRDIDPADIDPADIDPADIDPADIDPADIDPADIEGLLGAYAIDAVDDDERRLVESYLATNARARAEVRALREAATMLAHEGGPAPHALWDRIAAELEVRPPRPGPELAQVMPIDRRHRRVVAVFAGVAALAAAVIGTVVITSAVRDDQGDVAGSSGAIEQAYGEAWSDPAGRRTQLASADGLLRADGVVRPDGLGFLSARALPTLPDTETYQLWGVYADEDVISLGVIGNRPGIEPFTARGDIEALVITREQAGGVVSSTTGVALIGSLG